MCKCGNDEYKIIADNIRMVGSHFNGTKYSREGFSDNSYFVTDDAEFFAECTKCYTRYMVEDGEDTFKVTNRETY